MVMDRFTHVAFMLTLIIIGVNAHIIYFGDVVAPGQMIVPQPMQLTAQFIDVNTSASFESDAITEIKGAGESDFQIILSGFVSNVPLIGPILNGLGFLFDSLYNLTFGYTAVLVQVFGITSPIPTVIATIILAIQVFGLILFMMNVALSIRRTIA